MRSFAAAHNAYLTPPDDEGPCECCGRPVDDCICPECDICGESGNPDCYHTVQVAETTGDIRTGLKTSGKYFHTRQCIGRENAAWYQADLPPLIYNKEQLKGRTNLKIGELQEAIQNHQEYLTWLEQATDKEIADSQT